MEFKNTESVGMDELNLAYSYYYNFGSFCIRITE